MTSILEGVVQRGTAKKLKDLNLILQEKQVRLTKIQIPGLLGILPIF
jgi:hypothetical protein